MSIPETVTAFDLSRVRVVVFDVDGTLIDSNQAHADAWAQAFREGGFDAESSALRWMIGMGGDKLIPAVAHIPASSGLAKAIAEYKKRIFTARLPHLRPTRGARALLEHLQWQRVVMTVATSAGAAEVNALLEQAGVADLLAIRSSKDDAAESKPDPDIVRAALAKVGAHASSSLMIGDTPFDVQAAERAGVASVALRCGGYWSDDALGRAVRICDDPAGLLRWWQRARRVPTSALQAPQL
jgi:HAD superfamily hydrolase (TIGR01509 family)